jgi:hypothetical protein
MSERSDILHLEEEGFEIETILEGQTAERPSPSLLKVVYKTIERFGSLQGAGPYGVQAEKVSMNFHFKDSYTAPSDIWILKREVANEDTNIWRASLRNNMILMWDGRLSVEDIRKAVKEVENEQLFTGFINEKLAIERFKRIQ